MPYRDDEEARRVRRTELEREVARLQTRLIEVAGRDGERSRVRDELARVRRELDGCDRAAPWMLAKVILAKACAERWCEMKGDDRVRACSYCARAVFDLGQLTRDEASAVLATRGVALDARLYRRPDGTVMTSDCPSGLREHRAQRRKVAIAASVVTAVVIAAGIAVVSTCTTPEKLDTPEVKVDYVIPTSPQAPRPRITPIDGPLPWIQHHSQWELPKDETRWTAAERELMYRARGHRR